LAIPLYTEPKLSGGAQSTGVPWSIHGIVTRTFLGPATRRGARRSSRPTPCLYLEIDPHSRLAPAAGLWCHVRGRRRGSDRRCNCTCYTASQGAAARDWRPALHLCPIVQRIAAIPAHWDHRASVQSGPLDGSLTSFYGPFVCSLPSPLWCETREPVLPKSLGDAWASDASR